MNGFDDRFAALQKRFKNDAKFQLAQIQAALTSQDWRAIREICHSLSGRAGMFGYPGLGERAQVLEEAIDVNLPEPDRTALCQQVAGLLNLIR